MSTTPEVAPEGSRTGTGLPLVAVTGAAGRVGRITARALAGRYRLRLVDLDWPDDVAEDPMTEAVDEAERVAVDLRDSGAAAEALAGADLVLHLAAQPSPQIGVREAVEDVAMPTANVIAAVRGRASTVRRVVYASSIHSMGLYDRHGRHPIDPAWPTHPCCEYGTAKVFGENLLRLLTERSAVTVACLRLGLTGMLPETPHAVSHWLGDEDYGALVRGALAAEVGFGCYFGVSVPGRSSWQVANAEDDLGYVPRLTPPEPGRPDPDRPGPDSICLMGG